MLICPLLAPRTIGRTRGRCDSHRGRYIHPNATRRQLMSAHGYEQGRLDLPFVGHCTFGKRPICTRWDEIDADVAVLGIPYDMGTQYRSGARFGPRAIREASTLFSFGHGGA